jgi:hypothetical protein
MRGMLCPTNDVRPLQRHWRAIIASKRNYGVTVKRRARPVVVLAMSVCRSFDIVSPAANQVADHQVHFHQSE